MSIQQNQIVQPTYNGQDIFYRTPVDAIITDGMSLDDYIRNTTGVVESGSNTNGSYIKFADGTLIQQGNTGSFTVPAGTAGSKDVTFPINFYDINYYVTQTSLGGAYYSWVAESTTNKTISGFKCNCWNNTSASAADVGYSWIAVGRWKDYDASVLPDEQQSTIINSSSTNYYDDERVIGIWRDGKPLYRKTIVGTSKLPSGWSTIPHNISNLGTHRVFKEVDFEYGGNHCGNQFTNTTSFVSVGHFSDIDIGFSVGSSWGGLFTPTITVEYTKTTDQPVTSQTKDLLTVVNGKNITDLETIIQQRIDQLLEDKLKERKVATAFISGNISYSANSKIAFDQLITSTDKLTLSSGGIRIGKGIAKILVSAQAFANPTNNTTGYFWTSIKKNSTTVSTSLDNPSSWFTTVNHSHVLIDVTEGDIIYLYDVGSTSTGTIRGGTNTYLTIEVIKEQG